MKKYNHTDDVMRTIVNIKLKLSDKTLSLYN